MFVKSSTLILFGSLLVLMIGGMSFVQAEECEKYQRDDGKIICVYETTAQKLMERGWKIIKIIEDVEDKPAEITNITPKTIALNLSSPVEFIDDGREIQFAKLQKSPAPWPMYDRILTSMDDGLSVSVAGLATFAESSHEKYSINSGVGFYAQDWMPDYIPEGQKLLYTDTTCFEKTGDCTLGIHFVPTTFVLHENVTNADLKISKGFIVNVNYSPSGQDEVEDNIEFVKEIFEPQPRNYGIGFVDMTRDGKDVYAFEGGNALNHYRAVIGFNPDEYTSVGVLSHYYTLDEIIPIFESIMK